MTFQIDVLVLWGFLAVTVLFGCLAIWAWTLWLREHGGPTEEEWRHTFEPGLDRFNLPPVPPETAEEWAWPIGPLELEEGPDDDEP